jgi:NitT/TauT family transport system permease protein
LLGSVRPLAWVFRPVLEVLRPIPGIAWIPLAILWFGIGDSSSYFIVAIACFFPIFISAYIAIMSVDRRYLEMARSLGAPRWGQALQVMLPAALPRIMTGLRVGLGVAWMTVIAAELVAARSGLGYMIELNRSLIQTPAVLVGMIVIGVLGFLMATLLEVVERVVLHWERP